MLEKKTFIVNKEISYDIEFVHLKDDFFAYKLSYPFAGNTEIQYGFCLGAEKENLKNGTGSLSILKDYYFMSNEFENVIGVLQISTKLQEEFSIEPKFFFSGKTVNVDNYRFVKTVLPKRPHDYVLNASGMFFSLMHEYGAKCPMQKTVHVNTQTDYSFLDPILSDRDYDLEKAKFILEKRLKEVGDVYYGTNFFKAGEPSFKPEILDEYYKSLKELKFDMHLKDIEEYEKNINLNKKKKYINFSWFGDGKQWEEYCRIFVNKGVEAANVYIIEDVLKIPRIER